MSFRDPRVTDWESRLKQVFNEIDAIVEEEYSDLFPLRPNRPGQGETADPSADGLFDLGAAFSPGYGSEYGKGYIVSIRVVTLTRIPKARMDLIEDRVIELLKEKLPRAFPDRDLRVELDGHRFKIVGDLSVR
ncbi:MAG: hypothetical protein H7A43_05400 [Verrucomicrobia bacterium]|nr:hypothetical protein [Kiritimatiellia bacterium]MCB1101448.1 hypothetical protein [Kiritimatiellia bacterium]MCP5488065.1 hypothetical protein [Verrucomicrobiota bacterium]